MKSEIKVPDRWKVKKLDDLSTIKGRVGWRGYTVDDLRDSGPIAIGANNISNSNKIILDNSAHISKEKYEESPEIIVKRGDILVVQRGSLGKIGLINLNIGEATINPSMILVKNITISNQYLYFFLCSRTIQKRINSFKTQTGVPMISQKQCKNLKILIPPEKEQQKIADILSKVDEQIDFNEKIISKTEELKKGLMQKLFTKGIGHTKFKKTELGEIPEEWEIKKLKKLFRIIDYRGRTPPFSERGIPYIGANNVKEGVLDLRDKRFVDEETYSKYMNRGIPSKNSLLFTTEAPLGNVCLSPNYKFCIAQRVIAFEPFFKGCHKFFKYLLMTKKNKKQFYNWATGTTVKGISSRNLNFIRLFYSKDIKEMIIIGDILSKVDEQIQDNKKELNRLNELKKGLMQDLLTGKVRVTV